MSEDLLRAYRLTRYAVGDDSDSPIAEIMVDETSTSLDELLARHGAVTGVFITAWNPRSEPTDPESNDAAHARLRDELTASGVRLLPHVGIGSDPAWHPEHGFFALDLPEELAVRTAASYGQNAIVVAARGEPARLVLTPVMLNPGKQ